MQTVIEQAIGVLRRRPPTPARPLSPDEARALAALFRLFRPGMLGVARRIVRNREDAEDVVQDVFARLPVAIARYRDGAFAGWLKQVTTRQALMRIRTTARRREELGQLYLMPSLEARPDDRLLADGPGLADVAALIQSLPWPLRHVVELRYFRGLTHDAIARELRISRTASHIRLSRAIKQLRARAQAEGRRAS